MANSDNPDFITYDEDFGGIVLETDVIVEEVNFSSLKGVEKGNIITLSNFKDVAGFKNLGSCGLFDTCSTYSTNSLRFQVENADGVVAASQETFRF